MYEDVMEGVPEGSSRRAGRDKWVTYVLPVVYLYCCQDARPIVMGM